MNLEVLARMTARELFDGTAVVFLGAGASVGDDSEREAGEGVPGSSSLTKALAEEFDIDLDYGADGNLLDFLRPVASLAVKRRDESTVKRFVIDRIHPGCGASLKAHRALASVEPHTVITTNYDDLYESAWREAGKDLEKVVRPEQLPRIRQASPRLIKLHGDLETPNEIVLTRADYRRWQREAGGLEAKVVATLQESMCVFVGYGVGDENLYDILNIIEKNLGDSSLKHFALVHHVDEKRAAEWDGRVEFVAGDATEFCELVAREHGSLGPAPFNPGFARATFERQLSSGELSDAGKTCGELTQHLEGQGERAGAASLWRSFGQAARETGEHAAAAAAFKRAGELFLEAGYDFDAEPALSAAAEEASEVDLSTLEREVQPLLQRARLSEGKYDVVLRDTERALDAHGGDANPSLVYALRAARAEACEATEGIAAAKEEFVDALGELPKNALYFRVRAGADLARLLADEFDWDGAHGVLNSLGVEVSNAATGGHHGHDGLRRMEAILKLVRANVHYALGEDAYAVTHYRESAPALEELGEPGFAVSALQGAVASAPLTGYFAGEETTARLGDLARASDEQRRCSDLQRQGVQYLAEDKLAAARSSLARAEAAANALHSPTRARSVRGWFADVLLEAGFAKEALVQYAEAGERKKVERVAEGLREEVPPQGAGSLPPVDRLLELTRRGPVHSRGPAYVGLVELWDIVPEESLLEIVDQLSDLPDIPSHSWADRNVLPEAAKLSRLLMPRFSDEQAEEVGAALVSTVNRDDVFWTSHKEACQALANLAGAHPRILGTLEVPVDRLAELAQGDVLNDTVLALTALVNLGLNGHAESRRKALELLEGADSFTRVSWRQILGEATDAELTEAIRQLLPQSVNRVETKGNMQSLGMGAFNPRFLERWDLPEGARSEVADALSEAVAEPAVALGDRRAAAIALGRKAADFDAGDREKVAGVLLGLLTEPLETHPMLGSLDNPLSMLRMDLGEPDDVTAAVAYALLSFSRWVDDDSERRLMRREIERLRASQAEELGIGVAEGIRGFEPRDEEEERWLRTRLLLLLNSPYSRVRQGAARSLASLVERVPSLCDAELLDTVLHLSAADDVEDRRGAAWVLAKVGKDAGEDDARIEKALDRLRDDPSHLVRIEADGER